MGGRHTSKLRRNRNYFAEFTHHQLWLLLLSSPCQSFSGSQNQIGKNYFCHAQSKPKSNSTCSFSKLEHAQITIEDVYYTLACIETMMLHLLYPSALSGHCLFVVSGMESPVVKCRHSCDQEQLIDGPGTRQLPLAIAGIFQISVKTSQIKPESETAWDSLDCSRNWWQRRVVPT